MRSSRAGGELPEGWSFGKVIWVAVDSHGDLYVGETLEGKRIQKFIRKN